MVKEKVAALRALAVPGLPRFRADATSSADASNTKRIYFIRHGEAEHNVAPKPWGEELVDARLTALGMQQASVLQASAEALPLDLIIVSPLSRAISTAVVGLSSHVERGVPCLAVEGCREQLGQNLPDRRRPISEVAREYPQITFDGLCEEDELFTPVRESLLEISQRADAFLQLLDGRPERNIAVVTHSSFLLALCNVALDTTADPAVGEWFENAEMRCVQLTKR